MSTFAPHEKRTMPRYSFVAVAQIVDPLSGLRLSGRISELSRKGCYVDIINTLPKGTPIELLVSRDSGEFSCTATIIYVLESMGMGIAFNEVAPQQMNLLDEWLAQLASASA